MPNRDETGPYGCGPNTGRGFGSCGLVLRRGYGRKQGFRRISKSKTITIKDQKKLLEEELIILDKEKQEIEKKLKEIE